MTELNKFLWLVAVFTVVLSLAACDKVPEESVWVPDTNETIIIPPTDVNKEKAYLNNGVEYIIDSDVGCHISGKGAFSGEELVIPEKDPFGRIITYIDDYAFKDCTNIKKVVLSDNIKEIHGGAFQGCSSIESVEFGNKLEKIEVFAFYGCSALKNVSLPASIGFIGQGAFTKCPSIGSFEVAEDGEKYVSKDGVLYSADMQTLVLYPIAKIDTQFTVPSGVKTINNSSFEDCPYIETVIMASTVENVADHAFRRCSKLKTVTLSSSLKRLGVGSFYECKALATVNYPGTKETWEDDEKIDLANTWDRGAGKYTVNYEYKG